VRVHHQLIPDQLRRRALKRLPMQERYCLYQ
jgi:hypothetical protein